MKKILVSLFLLVFGLCLVGCEQPHTDPKDEFYLHGIYSGECIYTHPASSSFPNGSKYEFVDNKYNNIQYIKLESISGFFDESFEISFTFLIISKVVYPASARQSGLWRILPE